MPNFTTSEPVVLGAAIDSHRRRRCIIIIITKEHTISGEIVRVYLLVRPFKFFPSSDIFKHLAYSYWLLQRSSWWRSLVEFDVANVPL